MAEDQNYQGPQMAGRISEGRPERGEGGVTRAIQTYQTYNLLNIISSIQKGNAKTQQYQEAIANTLEEAGTMADVQAAAITDMTHILKDIRDRVTNIFESMSGQYKKEELRIKRTNRANTIQEMQNMDKGNDKVNPYQDILNDIRNKNFRVPSSKFETTDPGFGRFVTTVALLGQSIASLTGALGPDFGKKILTGFGSIEASVNVFKDQTAKLINRMKLTYDIGKQKFTATTLGESISNVWAQFKANATVAIDKIGGWLNEKIVNPLQNLFGVDTTAGTDKVKTSPTMGEKLKNTVTMIGNWFKENKFVKWIGGTIGWLAKKLTPIAVFFSALDGWDQAFKRVDEKLAADPKASEFEKTVAWVQGAISGFTGSFIGGFGNFVRNIALWPIKKLLGDEYVNDDGTIKDSKNFFLKFLKGLDEYDFAKELTDGINFVFDLFNRVIGYIQEKIAALGQKLGFRMLTDAEETKMADERARMGYELSVTERGALVDFLKKNEGLDFSNLSEGEINKLAADATGLTGYTQVDEGTMRMILKTMRAKDFQKLGKGSVATYQASQLQKLNAASQDIDALDKKNANSNINVAPITNVTGGTTNNTKVLNQTIGGKETMYNGGIEPF